MIALVVGAAVLAYLVLHKSGGAAATEAPVLGGGIDPATEIPANAGPPAELGKPTASTATAQSGTKYVVWLYPPDASGRIYTIARLAAATLWVSFTYDGGSDKSIPAKTNATGEVLAMMKRDWRLPQ